MVNCLECGSENEEKAVFCQNCGKKLTQEADKKAEVAVTSRTFEVVLGLVGGFVGLFSGLVTLGMATTFPFMRLPGLSQMTISLVGMVGAILVTKNPKIGGYILIISAICLFINSFYGFFMAIAGAFILVIAGIFALRKW